MVTDRFHFQKLTATIKLSTLTENVLLLAGIKNSYKHPSLLRTDNLIFLSEIIILCTYLSKLTIEIS